MLLRALIIMLGAIYKDGIFEIPKSCLFLCCNCCLNIQNACVILKGHLQRFCTTVISAQTNDRRIVPSTQVQHMALDWSWHGLVVTALHVYVLYMSLSFELFMWLIFFLTGFHTFPDRRVWKQWFPTSSHKESKIPRFSMYLRCCDPAFLASQPQKANSTCECGLKWNMRTRYCTSCSCMLSWMRFQTLPTEGVCFVKTILRKHSLSLAKKSITKTCSPFIGKSLENVTARLLCDKIIIKQLFLEN